MNTASQSLVQVGVSMVLRDNFTKEAGKISQSFRTMMADMDTLSRGYRASFGDISEIGMNLVGSMYEAYKYSAGVQNEIWLTSKIAGANLKESKELWEVAQQVNKETPLSAAQVASAERYLAMAGNSADKIQDLIGPASKLASIFGMNPGGKGGVADIMTNIMAMFQMDTSNASRVADDIYTAVTNANMSLEDLMATVRYSGADMAAAGVSFRELAAAAGALGDVGIQGTMAGTSLGNMIRYLQLSIAGQKKYGFDTLNELGLSVKDFYDEMGNFKGIGNALQQFLGVYKNMISIERTQDFYNMLGVRGMRGMIPILEAMAKGNDKFLKIMGRYDSNQGIVERINQERLATNAGLIDQFESSVENLITTFGKASEGPFRGLLEVGTQLVDSLNSFIQTDFGAKTTSYAVGMIITGTVWMTLKGILAFVQNITAYTSGIQSGIIQTANNTRLNSLNTMKMGEIMRTRLLSIEGNMTQMIVNQRTMISLLGRLNGIALNSAEQWYVTYPDRYGKTSKGQKAKKGQYAGGGIGRPVTAIFMDDDFESTRQQQKPPTTPPAGGGKKGLGSIITTAGTWVARNAGKLTNKIGIALMVLETGQYIASLLTDATKENTEALKANEEEERKRRENLWYEAVKQGVIDGMKNGKFNLNVNSNNPDISITGGDFDYTGGALLGM